ncbi:hypothetical protein FGO68_gene12581 [Halteria grandinella]|uniref:Uncharacterized protein n=1 Tax=Halteria grandinella TaxID=5974 RepID=A0A8J8NWR9_HALGN|nr:hypothetical protein FGO68_gene12581 [Halteria grandinella]
MFNINYYTKSVFALRISISFHDNIITLFLLIRENYKIYKMEPALQPIASSNNKSFRLKKIFQKNLLLVILSYSDTKRKGIFFIHNVNRESRLFGKQQYKINCNILKTRCGECKKGNLKEIMDICQQCQQNRIFVPNCTHFNFPQRPTCANQDSMEKYHKELQNLYWRQWLNRKYKFDLCKDCHEDREHDLERWGKQQQKQQWSILSSPEYENNMYDNYSNDDVWRKGHDYLDESSDY